MRKNRNLLRFATLLRFANGDAANVNEKLKINYKK